MSQHKNSVSFFERLFFKPNVLDWVIIFLLSPLALLYATIMLFRRVFTLKKEYFIPIISIGNLTVGGSGKTPFVIALASHYNKVTIISRGYGRQSKGLVEVSCDGHILTDVFASGDEPMLMAKSLKNASVIVSENRQVAIDLALSKGAKIIFLDDGFNRVEIKKFEILLFPKNIKNYLPFPAGPFREFYFSKWFSDLNLYEELDFKREVTFENETEKMLLVTAISNPERLKPFLLTKNIVGEYLLEDHAYFDENLLKERMLALGATSLLVTQKDEVKMKDFQLPLSVMQLRLQIKSNILKKIDTYIGEYKYER
jgi:tetraacyldisaccharide 4'-kinase